MSADAHAGHDHGQGAHESEGFTPNQKSVALAAFVIAALAGTIYGFARHGAKLHPSLPPGPYHAAPAAHGSHDGHDHDRSAKIELRRPRDVKVFPPTSAGGRMRFAAGLERRFQRRGRDVAIQATGDDSTTFQLTYSANAADQRHLEELKRAEGLQRELKGRGFTKLVLRVGDREVFRKELK